MSKLVTDKLLQDLQTNFRIVDHPPHEEIVTLDELLDERYLKSYLLEISEYFNTDDLFVVGSQFMKRAGFLLVVPSLYTMTVYKKRIPLKFKNYYLVSAHKNENWLPNLYIKDLTFESIHPDAYNLQRNKFIEELFKNIYLLITNVSNITLVPRPILWENIAIYIYWLYENKINGVEKERLSDLSYLVNEVMASTFHESYNPLKRFYNKKVEIIGEEKPIRIRRTCCFYYKSSPSGGFCKTCPKAKFQ